MARYRQTAADQVEGTWNEMRALSNDLSRQFDGVSRSAERAAKDSNDIATLDVWRQFQKIRLERKL